MLFYSCINILQWIEQTFLPPQWKLFNPVRPPLHHGTQNGVKWTSRFHNRHKRAGYARLDDDFDSKRAKMPCEHVIGNRLGGYIMIVMLTHLLLSVIEVRALMTVAEPYLHFLSLSRIPAFLTLRNTKRRCSRCSVHDILNTIVSSK